MSKMRKLLIALLTIISAVCLTLVGCGETNVQFVDFENKTIEYDKGELFDASSYMDVYDVNGNMYYANVKIYNADGETVSHIKYIFKATEDSYKIVITVKDGDDVIATREIQVNCIDRMAPYITLLDMPSFGIYNEEVFVPIDFEDTTTNFNKKLRVERYVTENVDGEYVTTLDTQNAIVKNTGDFTADGVAFVPTKPGTYKISVYAWDNGANETDARVVSKDYSIKETADAWGEVEGFDSPTSLVANYHYSNVSAEYNPLRGTGSYVYVTNDDGDYLDAEGNILYKKVDESTTENRIAYYKKADAQATEYDVLAYYLSLEDYLFYDAENNVSKLKEGCVRAKDEKGVDISFNNKFASIGQEWYDELTDDNGVTKFGVIKTHYSENIYADTAKKIFLKSSTKSTEFLRTYNGNSSTGWVENPKYDYLSFWMLIQPKEGKNPTNTTVSVYSQSNFNITKVPVGEWFEYKVSKAELRQMNYPFYYLSVDRLQQQGSYINISNQDAYNFDFYFDNVSYAKGADITTGTSSLIMGQPLNLDIENCGELTKDDFIFYIGKADNILNTNKNYNTAFFEDHVIATNATYTPEVQADKTSQKYYVQAKLSADGVVKNNGRQIYASTIITVKNVAVELSGEELGQEVTITANLEGIDNLTYTYFIKETSATEWTQLTNNKFTPSKPTSYDVKVVATNGTVQVEKTLTKDYTKAIAISVRPASGDDKPYINKDLTIVTELKGSSAISVAVKDSNGDDVTVTDGVFNVSKMDIYTIIANTTFNGVAIENTLDVRVAGPAEVVASIAETATIGVTESLEITATTGSEYTLSYSVKLPTGTIMALDSNVLPIEFVGVHEIYVTAMQGTEMMGEAVLTTTIKAMTTTDIANTGIYATFGYDGSEIAAWNGTAASYKGLNTEESVAHGTLANGDPWRADWHESITDKNGVTKYGVVSTRPSKTSPGSSVANGIHLRSDVYSTSDVNAPFFGAGNNGKPYFDNGITDLGKEQSIEYAGYDYLSIPVYIPKADAEDGEYATVRLIYAVQTFKVPYNTWYELKIDKMFLAGNMSSYQPNVLFGYRSGAGYQAIFYLSPEKYSDDPNENAAKLAADKDQIVYIDGIRTAKYENSGEFTSARLVLTDSTGATTGEEVGHVPTFQATSIRTSGTNKYAVLNNVYIKPELYVGDKLIPLEDIVVERRNNYQSSVSYNGPIVNVKDFNLKNDLPRTDYSLTLCYKYTDPDTNITYRKYFLRMYKVALPTA